MDMEGQRLEGLIGPYDEDSNVLLICEAEGGLSRLLITLIKSDVFESDDSSEP